jgi:4-amino-4-deoxy-L-arabinose transferase-like glycosyltransferase
MDSMVVSAAVSEQSKPNSFADVNTRRLTLLFLSLVLATSLGVRAYAWHHWGTGAIESEGAEYARIAQNLREGQGYVGISTPGTQLTFPPLFPALIAAASLVTHNDYELAGRLVSLLLGALLPLPVFGMALRLFNWRTAAVAALMTTFFPMLVNLSFTVFSEGPYITVLLSAVYLALRAFDRRSILSWSLVGGAFGLAYLTRQEAVVPLSVAVLLGLIARDATLGVKLKRAAAALTVFIVFASPQILLIYNSTGKLRLEGRSTILYAWGMGERAAWGRAGSGANEALLHQADYDAANSINDRLEPTGAGMRSNADLIRETHVRVRDLVPYFAEAVRRNTPDLLANLRERWLGAPFLPALALLGALRRPWQQRTAFQHLFFILVPATAIMATFAAARGAYARHYFVLTPFLLIWGANGLVGVARWINRNVSVVTHRNKGWGPGALVSGFIVIVMLSYASKDTRNLFTFREGSAETHGAKDAGIWIQQQQSGRVRVMDVLDTVAFHADAEYVHFPSCDAGVAIRYIEKEKVDYVVFRRGFDQPRYYKDWLQSGIPDARAQLVFATAEGDPNGILVFRWNQQGAIHP